MRRLDQNGVIAEFSGPARAGDGLRCAVNAGAGNQELSRGSRLAGGTPNAIDFVRGKQNGLAGRADEDIAAQTGGVVAADISRSLSKATEPSEAKGVVSAGKIPSSLMRQFQRTAANRLKHKSRSLASKPARDDFGRQII